MVSGRPCFKALGRGIYWNWNVFRRQMMRSPTVAASQSMATSPRSQFTGRAIAIAWTRTRWRH